MVVIYMWNKVVLKNSFIDVEFILYILAGLWGWFSYTPSSVLIGVHPKNLFATLQSWSQAKLRNYSRDAFTFKKI